jgi:hypothetical protein
MRRYIKELDTRKNVEFLRSNLKLREVRKLGIFSLSV